MADDVTIKNASSAVETIAADEVGGKKYQIVKMALGADGTATQMEPGQQTAEKCMPVVLPSAQLTALTDALTALLTELQAKADLSETQPVNIEENAVISTANSVSGTYSDSFSFDGTYEDVSQFSSIAISSGATPTDNVTQIDVTATFSADGVNPTKIVTFSGAANSCGSIIPVYAKYVKVSVLSEFYGTSDITCQLQTIFNRNQAHQRLNVGSDDTQCVSIAGQVELNSTGFSAFDYSGLVVDQQTGGVIPKNKVISASSSGDNTIISAVTGKKIKVLSGFLSFSGAVNAKFQSGASGTDISGLMYGAANGFLPLPYNTQGWFETASGALLNLNLSSGVAVGGCITYIEVD